VTEEIEHKTVLTERRKQELVNARSSYGVKESEMDDKHLAYDPDVDTAED